MRLGAEDDASGKSGLDLGANCPSGNQRQVVWMAYRDVSDFMGMWMAIFLFAAGGAVAGAVLSLLLSLLFRGFGQWGAWAAWPISAGLIAATVFIPDYSGQTSWPGMLADASNQIALVSAAIGSAVPAVFLKSGRGKNGNPRQI
jgi:hypothetical protein